MMSGIRITTQLPPELYEWLGDVYPTWLQLPPDDFYRLVHFNAPESPLNLFYAETAADIGNSAIFRNLRVFLELVSEGRIVLQQDSTMTSDTLELLVDVLHWPNNDMSGVKDMRRPLDEENICPLDFLKALAISSQLIKVDAASITIMENGHRILEEPPGANIIRMVFEAAFSKVNPRTLTKLAHPWVHEQAGVIFWGLSLVGNQPRSANELTRYCFVPPKQFFDYRLTMLPVYMRAVFLNPLIWFGLMETRNVAADQENPDGVLYQNTPLFDKFMHFDTEIARPVETPN